MRRHNCTIIDDRFIRRPDLLSFPFPLLSPFPPPPAGLELRTAEEHRGHRSVAIAYYYDENEDCARRGAVGRYVRLARNDNYRRRG